MRTLAEIDADIAEVKQAHRDLLLGKRPQSMKHGDREISFGSNFGPTKLALEAELLKLGHERSQLTGERSPMAPYHPRGIGAR